MDAKAKILDIAMNLNRIGNWAADDYNGKKERIKTFLGNTNSYLNELSGVSFPKSFSETFNDFLKKYRILYRDGLDGPGDPVAWAEDIMTWGNILTHRTKLLTEK